MKKIFIPFLIVLFFAACTKDKKENAQAVATSGFPKDVGTILINKCATSGCHNTQSAEGADGLDYSSPDNMFKGGFNGASVIPYSTDFSFMLYFVNTDSTIGLALEPKMPFNGTPLTKTEYLTLKNWIANGAPDVNGFVKFSDDPNRKKFYVCMQPCDQVAVFDAATRVIMRYIEVGVDKGGNPESPHQVRITPDGKYWCVTFYAGHVLQIFNTSDDKLVRSVEIGSGQWNTVTFTPDSKTAYVADLSSGNIVPIDLTTFAKGLIITGISNPHGTYITKDSVLYVTSQTGNIISKYYLSVANRGSIDPVQIKTGIPNADPHEIAFTPDESKYFVSCQTSNEVRVFDAATDTLIKVFSSIGTKPQEFSVSKVMPYIFVTCTEDVLSPSEKGSVSVINYNTLQLIKTIYPGGYQPHGIAVNDDQMVVYVANLNYAPDAPAPHHVTSCGGKNGNVTIIDMMTLDLLQVKYPSGNSYTYKNEVLPYPYFVAYRK